MTKKASEEKETRNFCSAKNIAWGVQVAKQWLIGLDIPSEVPRLNHSLPSCYQQEQRQLTTMTKKASEEKETRNFCSAKSIAWECPCVRLM